MLFLLRLVDRSNRRLSLSLSLSLWNTAFALTSKETFHFPTVCIMAKTWSSIMVTPMTCKKILIHLFHLHTLIAYSHQLKYEFKWSVWGKEEYHIIYRSEITAVQLALPSVLDTTILDYDFCFPLAVSIFIDNHTSKIRAISSTLQHYNTATQGKKGASKPVNEKERDS